MKFTITFLVLLLFSGSVFATSFTDFFANPNAAAGCTNINSGSTSTGAPVYTSTATAAGGWSGTVFTPDDGSTPASTVSAGMFASVYTNSVNTNAVYVGRITAVAAGVNGGITIDTVAKAGTAPTAVLGSAAAISIRVGGTWKGPYTNAGASTIFPFNFAGPNLTNSAGAMTCVNFIGGTNYSVSNAITHSVNGPMRWEGFTNTAHDGGLATISGGTTVAGFVLMTISAQRNDWVNLRWSNNGASGNADGVVVSGNGNYFQGCVIDGMRDSGFAPSGLGIMVESEIMSNNVANAANNGGVDNQVAGFIYERVNVHDNTNANASGFVMVQPCQILECNSVRNGLHGVAITTTGDPIYIKNSNLTRNGSSGIAMLGAVPTVSQLIFLENNNVITNGAFGITSAAGTQFKRNGAFLNNAFGTGSRTNASGNIGVLMSNVDEVGTILYASGVVPWVDQEAGNFQINLSAAYGTGRGRFRQVLSTFTNTVSYPSIGASIPAGFTNAHAAVFAQ